MCKKGASTPGLSGLEPPLCAACAMAFRHALNYSERKDVDAASREFPVTEYVTPLHREERQFCRSVDCKLEARRSGRSNGSEVDVAPTTEETNGQKKNPMAKSVPTHG